MLSYRAALRLSSQTLSSVDGVIRRHRSKIGSCWHRLDPGRQALLVLIHLRETFAHLAAGVRRRHGHGARADSLDMAHGT